MKTFVITYISMFCLILHSCDIVKPEDRIKGSCTSINGVCYKFGITPTIRTLNPIDKSFTITRLKNHNTDSLITLPNGDKIKPTLDFRAFAETPNGIPHMNTSKVSLQNDGDAFGFIEKYLNSNNQDVTVKWGMQYKENESKLYITYNHIDYDQVLIKYLNVDHLDKELIVIKEIFSRQDAENGISNFNPCLTNTNAIQNKATKILGPEGFSGESHFKSSINHVFTIPKPKKIGYKLNHTDNHSFTLTQTCNTIAFYPINKGLVKDLGSIKELHAGFTHIDSFTIFNPSGWQPSAN